MIICCGDALIDMLPRMSGEDQTCFLPAPGGAIFNTAIALARLGEDVSFLSGISNDSFGQLLIESLHESNVDTKYCVRSQRPSTLAFVNFVDGDAQYTFYDENSAGRMVLEADIGPMPTSINAMHFGGISLIEEPCGSTYEWLFNQRHSNTVLSLDPNIRQNFIKDQAQHRARVARMISKSDIVKVSDDDLVWIANGLSSEALIQSWFDDATKLVLVTHGSLGVTAFTSSIEVRRSADKAMVVDTVGAGDVFNAGILSGLNKFGLLTKKRLSSLSSESLESCLSLACKAAAFTVSQTGANSPWLDQLD